MYVLNCYVIDKIERDEDFPQQMVWGYWGEERFEVFFYCGDESDEELAENGFCLCEAPNWNETMLTEETNFSSRGIF